ncbi:MAG: hypothetical protein ACFBSF_21270 [Leptolyngbyaceae cyanobacterium]
MTATPNEKALALHQDILKCLQESDLEGILNALTQLYRPTAIADILQAKIGTLRLHDFVRPTTETGTWRVQEVKQDASGIHVEAAQHPNYDRTVSGPPDQFTSLEARLPDKPKTSSSNNEGNWSELQDDLENAPKVKTYLQALSHEFLTTDLPMAAVAEAVCSLAGDV